MEIKFDPTKLKLVNIDEIRPNTWNPKDKDTPKYQNIKKSLELKGFRLPVVVRENNGYEIIDGEQRWTAWKELGNTTIPIYNEGIVSDQEAKELTIWYEEKVPFNEISLANLIKDMVTNYQNLELPYSEEEMKEMLELANFNFDDYKNDFKDEVQDFKTLLIKCTNEQYEVIMKAIQKVKDQANGTDISESRSLELICADYLAGA